MLSYIRWIYTPIVKYSIFEKVRIVILLDSSICIYSIVYLDSPREVLKNMCGIVGVWNFNSQPVNPDELNRFTDTLAHRGPDGRGTFFDENIHLGFGHRRLSILDISDAAHQPMSYAQDRYWITYNGEIYNFIELKHELEQLGYQFNTSSDTEVILASYDRWGEECQLHFNGMWAFAIWDKQERKLFISRDRFGVKPLFYCYDGNHFAFASEMKAFLALEWCNLDFDEEIIATALTNHLIVEGLERSFLKNINKLLGGHCLIVRENQAPEIIRWWNTLDHLEEIPSSYKDQVSRFRELFLDACRIRMRSDVSLGCSLSGGLDSSSVLCGIKYIRNCDRNGERLAANWQKAFVATYPGTLQDERYYADEVIHHTGVTPVYCEISPSDINNIFKKYIYYYEDITEVWIGPWIVYRTQRENNVFVTLDGHGGDELLGGYQQYIYSLLIESLIQIPRWGQAKQYFDIYIGFYTKNKRAFNLCIAGISKIKKYIFNHMSTYCLEITRSLMGEKRNSWLLVTPCTFSTPPYNQDNKLLEKHDRLFNELYCDFHYFNLPVNLKDYDRLSMAHGVEVRSPFLDWRLVCYTFSLPSDSKIGEGLTKRILRDAMKGILPESIRSRTTKLGFGDPKDDWIFKKYTHFIINTIASKEFLESPIWDGRQISRDVHTALEKKDYRTVNNSWKYVQAMNFMLAFKKQREEFFPGISNKNV